MFFDALELLWSHVEPDVPEVPVVLPV